MLSPDGTRIVYQQSRSQSRIGLMLQRLDQFDPVPLPGTANAKAPFFSPDGKWIGYYDQSSRGAAEDCRRGRKPGNHLQGRDSSQRRELGNR